MHFFPSRCSPDYAQYLVILSNRKEISQIWRGFITRRTSEFPRLLLIEPHRQEACFWKSRFFLKYVKVPRTTDILKIRNDRVETVHIAYVCKSLFLSLSRFLSLTLSSPQTHMLTLISVSVSASGGQHGMELKTETLFIYGCYAPETEVGCRARATYLPLTFFLPPSAPCSLPLFLSLVLPILLLHDFMATLLYRLRASYLSKEKRLRIARHVSDPPLPT